MRDRLIALDMRRPMRLSDEDYDVPMLTESDFEIVPLPEHSTVITRECALVRDAEAWQELAQMCIAKAKLCVCIGHVLSAQYSILAQSQEKCTCSSAMLFPKKSDQMETIRSCDLELRQWIAELPIACQHSNKMGIGNSAAPIFVNRAQLNMTYFATVSALHRPQVLPLGANRTPGTTLQQQNASLAEVREAAREITRISQDLHAHNVERYLPTTGVTVLLSAIIIYLLDIKSCNNETRQAAISGLRQCMPLLEKLRDNYTSADFATQFLLALMRKLDIDIMISSGEKLQWENPPIHSRMDRANGKQARPKAAGWNSPVTNDNRTEANSLRDQTADINISVNRLDNLRNTTSGLNPDNEITVLHDQLRKAGLDFSSTANGAAANIDLDGLLKYDIENEMWNMPLERGIHGEGSRNLSKGRRVVGEILTGIKLPKCLPEQNNVAQSFRTA